MKLVHPSLLIMLLLTKPMIAFCNPEPIWPKLQVINQHNHPLNFYHDLVKNKTVAINFIFTTCSSSCPLATAVFKQVQKQLGTQPVHLISVSVDPDHDTPERLSAFAQPFNIATGWDFVTGDRVEITALLKALEVYSPDKNLHTNMVLIGNDATHIWTRLYGLPSADAIVEALKKVTAPSAHNVPRSVH